MKFDKCESCEMNNYAKAHNGCCIGFVFSESKEECTKYIPMTITYITSDVNK